MPQTINVGLDFGSTQYRAAYISNGKIIPVPIRNDIIWNSNILLFQTEKDFSFSSLKRQIGTGHIVPFEGGKESVENIILHTFKHIKRKIEDYAGEPIGQVTISVPARYSAFRRSQILRIAENAGFSKASLINDSTAATLAYTFERDASSTLLIYSMGYIGYEISLLRVAKQNLREIAHEGDDTPAGMDFDYSMINSCLTLLQQRLHLSEALPQPLFFYKERLIEICNQISYMKQQLSFEENEAVRADLSARNFGVSIPLFFTRLDFEELIAQRIQTTMEAVDRMLEDANVHSEDIDKVLLVGGCTRISYIQRQLEARFGQKLIQPFDEMLAKGAAIEADRIQQIDSAPHSLSTISTDHPSEKMATPTFVIASPTGPLETLEPPLYDEFTNRSATNEPFPIQENTSDESTETIHLAIESLFAHISSLILTGHYQQVDTLLALTTTKLKDARKNLAQLRMDK